MSAILNKLRETNVRQYVGPLAQDNAKKAFEEFLDSGVRFVSSHPEIEGVFYHAIHDLMNCIVPSPSGGSMLIEGADFIGMWLESTGTISTEHLSRYCPKTAQGDYELFADFIREDGLIPYKLTATGPAYRQLQMVTPLARCVWNHYCLNKDKEFLKKMYDAMSRNDEWLVKYRNTRGTGCVEAFCTFDTGNDASPRFWHCPDVPYGDPAKCDPYSPILPFLAPDMTANVYCQRKYLAKIAEELGLDGSEWREKAEQTLESLMKYCYDEEDQFFYDNDKLGRFVKVQTDVLMRAMECEVGDDAMFEAELRRYILNTKKFFPRYPLANLAMDDPRYLQDPQYNSWSGQTSYLTEIRIPHAFEYHHRYVELSWILNPMITAMSRIKKFSGSVHAWMGKEGYEDNYSPTMLCVLDFLERYCGIYPTPEEKLWFTALIPQGMDYGQIIAEETGYGRNVDDHYFEFINEKTGSSVYKDGELIYKVPYGVRLVTDREGKFLGLIGMVPCEVKGTVEWNGMEIPFVIRGNERQEYKDGVLVSVANPGVVPINYGTMDDYVL